MSSQQVASAAFKTDNMSQLVYLHILFDKYIFQGSIEKNIEEMRWNLSSEQCEAKRG